MAEKKESILTTKGFLNEQLGIPEKKFNLTEYVSKNRLSQYREKEKSEDYRNILKNYLFKDFNKPLTDDEILKVKQSDDVIAALGVKTPKGYTQDEWKDTVSKMLDRYSFETTKLNCMNTAYDSSVREAGVFKRYIGIPAYEVLTDVIDITDVGDLASLARIGAVGVGTALGGELIAPKIAAAGAGKIASNVGGIMAAEGVGAAADTTADYLRAKSENRELSTGEIAKDYGINYAANLAFVGMGIGAKKAFSGIYKGVKKSVVKGVAEAKTLPIDPIPSTATVKVPVEMPTKIPTEVPTKIPTVDKATMFKSPESVIPENLNAKNIETNTVAGAVEDIINKTTESDLGTLKAKINGIKDGEIDFEYKIGFDDDIAIEAKVIGLGTGKSEAWGKAANSYLQNNIGYKNIENKSRREVMAMLTTTEAKQIIERNVNLDNATALERASLAFVNNARSVKKVLKEKYPDPKDWDLSKVISPNSTETRRSVATFTHIFKKEGEKVFKEINEMLVKDSEGSIRSIDNFYTKFSNENNIIKSLYSGKLENPELFNEAEIKTFGNFREKYFNKVLKMDALKKYSMDDDIVKTISDNYDINTFNDIFIPSGEIIIDHKVVPTYALNPSLSEDYLKRSFSFSGIDNVLNKIEASDDVRSALKNLIYDKKLNTKKAITEGIRKLKAEGKLPKRIVGLQKEIDNLFKEYKPDPKQKQLEEVVKKLVSAENSRERQQLNRIWGVFNKKNVLAIQDLTTVKNNTTYENTLISKEEAFKRIDADKSLTPELKQEKEMRLRNLIADLQTKTGQRQLQVDLDYFGLEIPAGKNTTVRSAGEYSFKTKTKIEDIRNVDVAKLINKELGVDFRRLPEQIKRDELNSLCFKTLSDQHQKMGKRIYEKIGTLDLEKATDYYLEEWGIPKENFSLKFEKLPEGVGGSFRAKRVDGVIQTSINLSDIPGDDSYKALGILRHELEHLREFYQVPPSEMRNFDLTKFTNTPGVTGTEAFKKIKDGESVSLRELLGEFYGNHFYDWQNDTFESTLAGIEMAEKYNSLTGYDKLQMFLQSLSNTTMLTRQGKLSSSNLLLTNNLYEKAGLSKLSEVNPDVVEEFISRRFESPQNMIDFIAEATSYNNANRFNEVFQKLHGSITNENVGFSKGQLIHSLRSEASKLSKEKFKVKENAETIQVLQSYAEALSTHMKGLQTTTSSNYTSTKLVTGLLTNGVIGYRQFMDAPSAVASTSLQYIVHGEYSKGLKTLVENIPDASKMFGASITQATANLTDSTQRTMSAVLSNIKGYNVEVTAMDSFINKLRKVGENTEFVIDSNQRRIVSETLTTLNLLEENIDKNSLKGWAANHTMKGMLGLQSDDIFSQIMATKGSQSEMYDMLSKSTYGELNKIQKFMFGASGYTEPEFNIFKSKMGEVLENAEKVGLENSDDYLLRAVLGTGETQLDLMGRAKALSKGSHNPFMYLTQTIWQLATETITNITAYSDYGVYVGKKGPKELFETLAVAAGSTLGVAGGAYAVRNIARSLKDQQTPFTTLHDDVKELNDMSPSKLALTLSRRIGDVTPLSLGIKSSEMNAPYQVWFDIAKSQYKKGDLGNYMLRFYYGSMVGNIVSNLTKGGDDKETAHTKAMRYMTTPAGKKQFIDYTTKNIKRDSYKMYNLSKEKYYVDNREALKQKIITQDEYDDNINKVK